jgi:DeoR family transcriptional regulator of aga operon
VIAACDSSKIGATTLAKMVDLGDLDVLVTDSDITPDQLAAVRATGVDVQIVEAPRG